MLTQKILYIKALPVKLQGRYVDIVRAYREIENIKSTLSKLRFDVEKFYTQTYNEILCHVKVLALKNQHQELPINRQQHQQNLPSSNSSEYFKRTTTIPILDHLISELNVRYNESSCQFLL